MAPLKGTKLGQIPIVAQAYGIDYLRDIGISSKVQQGTSFPSCKF